MSAVLQFIDCVLFDSSVLHVSLSRRVSLGDDGSERVGSYHLCNHLLGPATEEVKDGVALVTCDRRPTSNFGAWSGRRPTISAKCWPSICRVQYYLPLLR